MNPASFSSRSSSRIPHPVSLIAHPQSRIPHLVSPITILLLLLWPATAFAHVRGGEAFGFLTGLQHPISGADHVVAMIAVGLWGAQLGPPAVWLLPVTFPIVMAFGGTLGLAGVKLPGIEVGIALSAVGLGAAVLFEARPKLWVAAALVGFFAIFHGHAHGTELPAGADGMLYSIGFVIATGLLHATGIAIGLIHRWPAGRVVLRVAGAGVALAGLAFLWRAIA
jgi:urease accessory protein